MFSLPRSFDYILDQQAYVAVDAGKQADAEVIQAFKSHPVHKVGGGLGVHMTAAAAPPGCCCGGTYGTACLL